MQWLFLQQIPGSKSLSLCIDFSKEQPHNFFFYDMGGAERMGGRKDVPENAPSRKILDPSKRASGLLSRGFLYRKKQSNDT